MHNKLQTIKRTFIRQHMIGITVMIVVASIGTYFLVATHAASPYTSVNASQGTLASTAHLVTDTNASNGQAVKFGSSGTGTAKCGLTNVAFCDTFNASTPAGERSGDMASVWGASRVRGGGFNSGQSQADAWIANIVLAGSCPSQTVTADNDIKICNGQLNEAVSDNPDINATNGNPNAVDDNGDVTALTMYPKQPFDFAGRTGKVVFDVSDDTFGTHSAWPEFWMTDKPVPNPFIHFSSWQSIPQFGFGIRLSAACGAAGGGPGQSGAQCGPNCNPNNTSPVVTVASAVTIDNYSVNDSDTLDSNTNIANTLKVNPDNCVKEPTQPGQLNHFEIDVSQNQIDVYGTDAGTTSPLKHLVSIPNVNLGFTRGLIWLEDAHYNACKNGSQVLVNGQNIYQCMHTFTWDNVGFDGSVLPRDLAFEVPDAVSTISGYPIQRNLGWYNFGFGNPNTVTVTDPNVSGVSQASAGLLVFNFRNGDFDNGNHPTISYSLNGHTAHTVAWPFTNPTYSSSRTIGVPVPLSEVVNGTNTISISDVDTQGIYVYNVGLIMVGAGGIVNP